MYALSFVALFFAFIAISQQKPVENVNQPSNNKDNGNGTSEAMTPKDTAGRTFGLLRPQMQSGPAYYPQWQQYVNAAPNTLYRNDEVMESAKTIGHLRPQVYSQYQTVVPQTYAVQAYQVPAYEYSAPYAVSSYGHYPSYGFGGYSGYSSYYKNAEEDKARQFMPTIPSSFNPGVQYASKYVVDKPLTSTYSNIPSSFYQPQIAQPMMQPMLIRHNHEGEVLHLRDAAEDKPTNFDYQQFAMYPRAGFTIDDKLQLQIHPDYLWDRIQRLTPADIAQSSYPQQQFSRAAEESQPMEWSQAAPGFPRDGAYQQIQDPYITPNDQVIMEPMPQARFGQLPRATYPNLEQQMKMGQMQYYYGDMNAAATQVENLAQDFSAQKSLMQNGPAARSAGVDDGMIHIKDLGKLMVSLEKVQSQLQADIAKSDKQGKIEQGAATKTNEADVPANKKN